MLDAAHTKTLLDDLADDADAKVAARYHAQAKEGLINPIVLAQLLDVRPQMIYGYIRKGKFTQENAFGVNNTQKITIRLDEANQFAAGYVGRKTARAEEEGERIKAELAGETYVKPGKRKATTSLPTEEVEEE